MNPMQDTEAPQGEVAVSPQATAPESNAGPADLGDTESATVTVPESTVGATTPSRTAGATNSETAASPTPATEAAPATPTAPTVPVSPIWTFTGFPEIPLAANRAVARLIRRWIDQLDEEFERMVDEDEEEERRW